MRTLLLLGLYFLSAAFSCREISAQQQKNKGYPDRSPDLDVLPGFINPPKGYGNVPFYWWNGDTLVKERLKEQLDILSASATDGFAVSYIHTVPHVDTLENKNGYGLYGRTEPGSPKVFSEEWWNIWNWFSGQCAQRGLGVGLDDYTVGWVGNGYYPDELDTMAVFKDYKGELVINIDTVKGEKKYSITTKPGYVIHPEHGKKLLDVYFNRFESKMDEAGRAGMNYFFQDELAYPINMLSWSDDFKDEFVKRKGYDITPHLPALVDYIGEITPKIRLDYSEVLMDLSEERYYKPIYDWHADRGLIYGCDNLSRGKDPTAYIDYFRAMSWYTAPGNDAPSRGSSFLETKVSSSITHLYKRQRTWLEAFHSMGWGSSGAWLTRQIDHHFIAGGNLVCMHGLYYSTHGGWWEWAPPDFHFRMPYWPHMKQWLKYTERMSYLLSQGSHACDIALMYPTEPLQAYPGTKPDKAFNVALNLSNSGFDYDFVDFRSLRKATATDKTLTIADERYKIIVLADMKAIHHSSLLKVLDFYRSGGIVLAIGALPKASDNKGENDRDVDRIVKELFGFSAAGLAKEKKSNKQTNRAGGIGWYIPDSLEKYIPDLITPDFFPEKRKGKVLHRKIGERNVYMVTDVEKGTECFFRSKGKVELWDANSGTVRPYPILRQTAEGTYLRMDKETSNSYLLVFSPGEPVTGDSSTALRRPSSSIPLNGEWTVDLLPTLNNKWGDYRFPANDGFIAAEARSFKYAPSVSADMTWIKPAFDDSSWKEEIYGYGPQVETKTDSTDWETVSFSWQYGVWDNPGAQGYHGLKGKLDDRFFILDKGKNQRFRTYVYVPRDGTYRIETEGAVPDSIRMGENEIKGTPSFGKARLPLSKGWHRLEAAYSNSEKIDYQMRTGEAFDDRKRSLVLLFPTDTPRPEKLVLYSNEVSSRWGKGGQLLLDPNGGKYNTWNFRFASAPGLEEMTLSVYGDSLKIWFDSEEIKQEHIRVTQSGNNWNTFSVSLPHKKQRIGQVAFSVRSEKGYQGTAVIKEPVQLKTSSGLLSTGDWSKEGALRYYSGGMYYRTTCRLPEDSKGKRIMLDLGDVVATCEIKINNQSAGILISPPYEVDITPYVKAGQNNIEVLVYSTLSNHYQTIPTPYRGDPKAGLIGPVRISVIE